MFVVLIRYEAPTAEVDRVRPAHREYLQRHYRSGLLVCSGPQPSGRGGVLLARGGDRAAVAALCAGDPYAVAGVAHHEIVEFEAKSYDPALADLVRPWSPGSEAPSR